MRNHGVQKDWNNIFQVLKIKNCQPRIPYPVEIFFRNKGEFKMFSDKGKLREFVTNRPTSKNKKFLNRKDMMKEGNWQHQKGRKEQKE